MATINIQRHQMVRKAVLQNPDAVVDITIGLWKTLAAQLVFIIGEGGFQSMYSRSLHLASADFPWLEQSHPLQRLDSGFAGLKGSFESHDMDEVCAASIALLTTFLDILTTLIGDLLTTSILKAAWGEDALDMAGKDKK
jgi:hypothetical protein